MASQDEEHYDSFNAPDEDFVFDPASIAHVAATSGGGNSSNNRFSSGASRTSRSAATTQLATDVGSVMLRSQTPFLKSVTFFDPEVYFRNRRRNSKAVIGEVQEDRSRESSEGDDNVDVAFAQLSEWDIQLCPPPSTPPVKGIKQLTRQLSKSKIGTALKMDKPPRYLVHDYSGLLEYSSIQNGDQLISINKRSIDPRDVTLEEARMYMNECMKKEGVLNVVTENADGEDILINITLIKPHPQMTYKDLGLTVWNWPYLCVHRIKEDSIFQHTPIQENDQIASINDIDCEKVKEREFAKCITELPEITLTLIRRKHRYTGSFR